MDRRVYLIRTWLLLIATLVAVWMNPYELWVLIAAPVIWTRTKSNETGILIHPDGAGGWKIAVGDDTDSTCACCTSDCPTKCAPGFSISSLTIVIVGMTNGTCSQCSSYNTTYIVDTTTACGAVHTSLGTSHCRVSGTNFDSIAWTYSLVPIGGGQNNTIIDTELSVRLSDLGAVAYSWRKTLGLAPVASPGCVLEDEQLTTEGEPGGTPPCSQVSATCTVTSNS